MYQLVFIGRKGTCFRKLRLPQDNVYNFVPIEDNFVSVILEYFLLCQGFGRRKVNAGLPHF